MDIPETATCKTIHLLHLPNYEVLLLFFALLSSMKEFEKHRWAQDLIMAVHVMFRVAYIIV